MSTTGRPATASISSLKIPILVAFILVILPMYGMGDYSGSENLLTNGGYLLQKNDRESMSLNPERQFIPASIAKIVTSLAALETLGPNYRFTTRLYLDRDHSLYIKGSGDPFMVSEEIRIIAAELKAAGVKKITAINLDGTIFIPPGRPSWNGGSLNPYDAVNSGLAVNFNTVFIVKNNRGIHSAEEQTPTLPLMRRLGVDIPSGRPQRINISAAIPSLSDVYAAQLFAAIFNNAGIKTSPVWERKAPPPGLRPIVVHHSSRSLVQVVAPMLLYSNNFIANQLFLALGAGRSGPPGDFSRGRAFMVSFLAAGGIGSDEIDLFEGSGLSRKNRVSCRGMLKVLERFKDFAALLPNEDGVLIKSGTMTGIYAYAGYFPTGDNLAPFVIILNQKRNTRDRILTRLRRFAATPSLRVHNN